VTLPEALLTTDDLARLLSKTPTAVRIQLHRNPDALPPVLRIPGTQGLRWDPRDVEKWLQTIKRNGSAPEDGSAASSTDRAMSDASGDGSQR
jgi:hypothetical protein